VIDVFSRPAGNNERHGAGVQLTRRLLADVAPARLAGMSLEDEFEAVCLKAIDACGKRSPPYHLTASQTMIKSHGAVEAARRLVVPAAERLRSRCRRTVRMQGACYQ
jgi:hypothetical protein